MRKFNDDEYVTEYRPRRGGSSNTVLILLIVLVLLVFAVAVAGIVYMLRTPAGPVTPATTDAPATSATPTTTNAPTTTEPPVTTEPVQPDIGVTFKTEAYEGDDIYRGDLILVNKDYAYNFSANASKDAKSCDLYDLWKPYPNYCYKLTGTKVKTLPFLGNYLNTFFDAFLSETGENDYLVTSAFRTYTMQQETLDENIEKYGSVEAALQYTAQPGYSEHHTGLAFDVYVYTDLSVTYKLGEAKMPELYNWIYDNAAKFGIVRRYTADKSYVTGYNAEPWHFRYVGVPHAELMGKKGLCLEEYISFVKEYAYPNALTFEAMDGKSYLIYYEKLETETVITPEVRDTEGNVVTPASASEQIPDRVMLHVPESLPYTVSGNNVDGFIVTVTLN